MILNPFGKELSLERTAVLHIRFDACSAMRETNPMVWNFNALDKAILIAGRNPLHRAALRCQQGPL